MVARRPYTPAWRDRIRAGVQSSAGVIAPLLTETFHPSTALDVGCGEGWFVKALQAEGVQAQGVDGSWVDAEGVGHVDLSTPPYPDLGRFDIVVCLEVAEHLPSHSSSALVEWLVSLAPTVVFSAAIPGQGGEGHVNEQWPQWWVELFAWHGMVGSGALRWRIWDNDCVAWWYLNNMLVFGDLHGLPEDGCPAVIHPRMWEWHGR